MNEPALANSNEPKEINPSSVDTARFWKQVGIGREDECWLWMSPDKIRGYGRFSVRGKKQRAHRIAWTITRGGTNGKQVLHRCDNPGCVNPNHLWLGTVQENMADMIAKGRNSKGEMHWSKKYPERIPRGEKGPKAKLTDNDVLDIRAKSAAGMTAKAISDLGIYPVHYSLIKMIIQRARWKHI